MRGLPQEVAGRVYKIWVGGRSGYRLIYLVHAPARIVVGLFFSGVTRSSFDYDDVDFLTPAMAAASDLEHQRLDRFTEIRVAPE